MIINPYRFSAGGGGSNGLLNNLVAHWNMDEASGNRADSSGSNDLSVVGTTGQGTGLIGNSGTASSTGSGFRRDSWGPVTGSGDRSVFAWVKITNSSSLLYTLFSWGNNANGQRFSIETSSGLDLQLDVQGGAYTSTGLTTLTTNTWYHVGATFSGTTLGDCTLWVNASSEACTGTRAINTTVSTANEGFWLNGSDAGSIAGFTGIEFDEVAVWSSVLTSDQVSDLYNGGSGLPYSSYTT